MKEKTVSIRVGVSTYESIKAMADKQKQTIVSLMSDVMKAVA